MGPAQTDSPPLGSILLDLGYVSESDLSEAVAEKERTPLERFGDILVRLGHASDAQIREALAIQYGLPFTPLSRKLVDPAIAEILPGAFLKKHRVVPMFRVETTLTIALDDPTNPFLLDEIARRTDCDVQLVLVPPDDLDEVQREIFEQEERGFDIDDIIEDIGENDVQVIEKRSEDLADLEEVAGMSPVVRLVNYILFRAIRDGASDIHIEPDEDRLRVRNRIDGLLEEVTNPPVKMHPAIVSRIKVMADLDISERRKSQDGRFRVVLERRAVDLRVSILPTVQGEKVVIRILDKGAMLVDVANLGLPLELVEAFREEISRPDGLILVTGPTGSGKSTTLYSILQEINTPDRNLCTVENPVEYNMRGINQVQVSERGGIGFTDALRALLRQDPDVIMIGEIRDVETAAIAVQASLTGHLVLATLHTNDSPSAVMRLVNMGVEPYLISASLRLVLSQRLIRRLCPRCKVPAGVPSALRRRLEALPPDGYFHGPGGCEKCRGSGFVGRIGLFEMLVVGDELRDKISANPALAVVRECALQGGMRTLMEDGIAKAAEGITSLDEVLRVAWS